VTKKLGLEVLLISFIGIFISFFSACSHKEGPVRYMTLRSEYKTLSEKEARSMIKDRGFFDKRWNKYHSFTNQFEMKTVDNQKIIIDHATKLVWHPAGSEVPLVYKEAKLWVRDLNKAGYGGYKNWRLPTLEEAASLLEQKKVDYRYIDPLFSSLQHSVHTGDIYSDTRIWGVSYQYGGSFRVGIIEPNFVRPVTKYSAR